MLWLDDRMAFGSLFMNLTHAAQRLVPSAVKGKVKQLIRSAAPLTANRVLDSIYTAPSFQTVGENKLVWNRPPRIAKGPADPLPIPPPDLRMAYNTDAD